MQTKWLGRKHLVGEAFGVFYAEHADALTIWFARRTIDPETAVDLAAETFAQAYLSRKRFRGESEASAAAWLYAIARHQLARYHRKGRAERRALARLKVELPALTPAEAERIETEAGLAELRGELYAGLQQITQSQRDAISLRIVDELPYPEVAARLGTSEQTARARVSRGLRALEQLLSSTQQVGKEVAP